MAQWIKVLAKSLQWLGSLLRQVQSPAQSSGLRIQCCCSCGIDCNSTQIRFLAQKLRYATGDLKKKKKKSGEFTLKPIFLTSLEKSWKIWQYTDHILMETKLLTSAYSLDWAHVLQLTIVARAHSCIRQAPTSLLTCTCI